MFQAVQARRLDVVFEERGQVVLLAALRRGFERCGASPVGGRLSFFLLCTHLLNL